MRRTNVNPPACLPLSFNCTWDVLIKAEINLNSQFPNDPTQLGNRSVGGAVIVNVNRTNIRRSKDPFVLNFNKQAHTLSFVQKPRSRRLILNQPVFVRAGVRK